MGWFKNLFSGGGGGSSSGGGSLVGNLLRFGAQFLGPIGGVYNAFAGPAPSFTEMVNQIAWTLGRGGAPDLTGIDLSVLPPDVLKRLLDFIALVDAGKYTFDQMPQRLVDELDMYLGDQLSESMAASLGVDVNGNVVDSRTYKAAVLNSRTTGATITVGSPSGSSDVVVGSGFNGGSVSIPMDDSIFDLPKDDAVNDAELTSPVGGNIFAAEDSQANSSGSGTGANQIPNPPAAVSGSSLKKYGVFAILLLLLSRKARRMIGLK